MEIIKDKFKIQEDQYRFPYHHLPYLDKNKNVVNHRSLSWGFKYFCYLLQTKELTEALNPDSVLDIGCGEGRFLGLLNHEIERKVGVDLSERPILFAKAFHPEIEFQAKDAADLQETFDVVTAIEVLEHIPDEQITQFLSTMYSRTKPGGHIIICVPTTVRELSEKHYRHYDINKFRKQLADSSLKLTEKKVEYVYHSPLWLNLYSKFTQNGLWIFEIKPLRNLVWKYIKKNLLITTPEQGEEMIIVLQKNL
ncbi:class I SAM-dependent methyltransferase [Gillisia sp. Q332]|uniref:class I SAM-dependent methyltransferase n=1 Tax=Gillisia xinjiangensis TaxID=3384765 RepID=UPI003918F3AC